MEKEVKYFEIFQKMIDENSSGISISTTITDSEVCPQGGLVEFGVERKFSDEATTERCLGTSNYMIFALFVDRKEFEKYKSETVK